MRKIEKSLLVLIVAMLGYITTPTVSIAATRVICISSSGALTVRNNKCLTSEAKATTTNLPQQGAKGATGAAGQDGLRGRRVEIFRDSYQLVSIGNQAHSFAFCNQGEIVVGGGCACFNLFCNTAISASSPLPTDPSTGEREGWRCAFNATVDPDSGTYGAYAICAAAG
ncbi:MAG: hypothetical protein EBZ48_13170 [Proteobacteria bacterium]|nr:hypothetical protein [Pseudomonadota bacterium]